MYQTASRLSPSSQTSLTFTIKFHQYFLEHHTKSDNVKTELSLLERTTGGNCRKTTRGVFPIDNG